MKYSSYLCRRNITGTMKKIMFNDKYGLTQAVLNGTKTVSRRIPGEQKKLDFLAYTFNNDIQSLAPDFCNYQVGEEVAVAQRYYDIYMDNIGITPEAKPFKEEHMKSAGWTNKMFVKAELMPHRIRIKSLRLEHLQDITDDDARRECTLFYNFVDKKYEACGIPRHQFDTPRDAFAALIDKVGGKGTWEKNPWVVRYEFELES